MTSILEPCFQIIDRAKAQQTACLVHCNYGMSRSPSVVIAYLMRSEDGVTLAEALRRVKELRPVTAPNYGFMSQLIEFERNLRGRVSIDVEKYRLNRCADPSEYEIR